MKIIQMFQWSLKSIIEVLPMVREQGFTHIQISPIQPTKEDGTEFWLLYQPTDFSIGNTQIGSREELKELCDKAHEIGLKIIADVVLRHVAGMNNGAIEPHEKVADYIKSLPYLPKKNIDYGNRYSEITDSPGLPSLDYNNTLVRTVHCNLISDLFITGVDGLRIDMGKHFALPREGSDFWTWLSRICRENGKLLYSEVIQTSKELLDEYCEFTMVGTDGSPSDRNKMIAWVESHDDFLTWRKGVSMTDLMFLNEYIILCNNFPNTLFYARPFHDLWMSDHIREINKFYK